MFQGGTFVKMVLGSHVAETAWNERMVWCIDEAANRRLLVLTFVLQAFNQNPKIYYS